MNLFQRYMLFDLNIIKIFTLMETYKTTKLKYFICMYDIFMYIYVPMNVPQTIEGRDASRRYYSPWQLVLARRQTSFVSSIHFDDKF